MSIIKYRPDIDGLRTLAVLPVIAYHAGAQWLPGGFVGVDIFFVISGYLISAIIIREVQVGDFSYLRFYERRLRRIIPALIAVLLVTVSLFQVSALPDQALSAAESAVAAIFSVSNFFFWRSSGYFAPTAEFMPLLHTWSLGVEEQFYLLFPIALLAVLKVRVPVKWSLLFITIAAFALNVWLSTHKPSVAYYLLPARAWELGIGAVLAAGAIPAVRSSLARELIPLIGIALIAFALFYIRSEMIFPGWVALLPCMGAAMILHSDGKSWIGRHFLASRPMVAVGLLSYSLYLWHWPVLASFRIRSASVHLDPAATALAIATTFVLATLSWRFVERPFRNRQSVSARRMFGVLGAGSLATIAIAALSFATGGFQSRLDERTRAALAVASDIDPLRKPCETAEIKEECRFGNPHAPVTYAIIGDSHAAAIRPAIEASGVMGNEAGVLLWRSACPLLDGELYRNNPEYGGCESFRDGVWKRLDENRNLKTIILGGRWPFHMTGWLPESGGSNRALLSDDQTVQTSAEENERVFVRSFLRTLHRLEKYDVNVIVVGSMPEVGFDVPHTVALARLDGIGEPAGATRQDVEQRAGKADALLIEAMKNMKRVRFVPLWRGLCDAEWCKIERDGVPIYSDDDHLSYGGAVKVVAPLISADFRP